MDCRLALNFYIGLELHVEQQSKSFLLPRWACLIKAQQNVQKLSNVCEWIGLHYLLFIKLSFHFCSKLMSEKKIPACSHEVQSKTCPSFNRHVCHFSFVKPIMSKK